MTKHEAGQPDHLAVVSVEAVEADIGHVVRSELDRRYLLQHRRHPAQLALRLRGAQPHRAEPHDGRSHELVFEDVVGEFVEAQFDRQPRAEAPAQLLGDPDAAADRLQGLLFCPVAVQQSLGEGSPGGGGQCQREAVG